MLQRSGIMFKIRRIAISRTDGAPVLPLPGFVVGDAHFSNGQLLVFAFQQRNAESLHTIGTGDIGAVAQGAFLVIFAGIDPYLTGIPKSSAPGNGRQVCGWEQHIWLRIFG